MMDAYHKLGPDPAVQWANQEIAGEPPRVTADAAQNASAVRLAQRQRTSSHRPG